MAHPTKSAYTAMAAAASMSVTMPKRIPASTMTGIASAHPESRVAFQRCGHVDFACAG